VRRPATPAARCALPPRRTSSRAGRQLAPHCEASAVIFVGSDCLTISAQASPPAPPLATPPVSKPPAPRRRSRAPPPRPLSTEAPSCAPARGRPGAGSRGGAPSSGSLHHARRRPAPARRARAPSSRCTGPDPSARSRLTRPRPQTAGTCSWRSRAAPPCRSSMRCTGALRASPPPLPLPLPPRGSRARELNAAWAARARAQRHVRVAGGGAAGRRARRPVCARPAAPRSAPQRRLRVARCAVWPRGGL
jgi:hypothetical protein